MSDYILHSIDLTVSPQLKLFELVEENKPVYKYPNYYLGKIIGNVGNELEYTAQDKVTVRSTFLIAYYETRVA